MSLHNVTITLSAAVVGLWFQGRYVGAGPVVLVSEPEPKEDSHE